MEYKFAIHYSTMRIEAKGLRVARLYDMWFGAVVVHQSDPAVGADRSHQTLAISYYSIVDGLLQGTGLDTDLLSCEAL